MLFFVYSISAVQKLRFNSVCLCTCKTDQLSLCNVLHGLKQKTECLPLSITTKCILPVSPLPIKGVRASELEKFQSPSLKAAVSLPLPQARCSGTKGGCDKHTRAGRSSCVLCEVQQLCCRMQVQMAMVTLALWNFHCNLLSLYSCPFLRFIPQCKLKLMFANNSSQKQATAFVLSICNCPWKVNKLNRTDHAPCVK